MNDNERLAREWLGIIFTGHTEAWVESLTALLDRAQQAERQGWQASSDQNEETKQHLSDLIDLREAELAAERAKGEKLVEALEMALRCIASMMPRHEPCDFPPAWMVGCTALAAYKGETKS